MPQLLSRKSGNTFKYSMAITYFMRAPTVSIIGALQGLKVVVHVLNKFGAGQKKWSTYLYIISGRDRKSGGAIALFRWAPLVSILQRRNHFGFILFFSILPQKLTRESFKTRIIFKIQKIITCFICN